MFRALAVGAAAAALLSFGTVPAASAAGHPTTARAACPDNHDFNADGVKIHTRPSFGSTVVGLGYRGDCVVYHGGSFPGDGTFWQELTDSRTGVRGYAQTRYVY